MLLFSVFLVSVYFVQIICMREKQFRRLDTHYKCLNDFYPETDKKVSRLNIADQEISWFSKPFFRPYDPPSYTAKVVLDGPDWADPELDALWLNSKPRWNLQFGPYNRACYGHLYLVNGSCPLNPIGRTGLKGRGLLGRWGPNHALHAVIARWKRDEAGGIITDEETGKRLFQFVSVKRYDLNLWSVPGRFRTGKDRHSLTIKKCVLDETLNNLKSYPEKERKRIVTKLNKFLADGPVLYQGYVDDPRNTDNAWVSTIVILFLDDGNNITDKLRFEPGPSVADVKWMDAVDVFHMEFYGNHEDFLKDAAAELGAYYPLTDYEKELLKKEQEQYTDESYSSDKSSSLSNKSSSSSKTTSKVKK